MRRGRLLMQLDEGELGCSVDGYEEIDFALLCSDFGDVDVEVADRVAFELGSLGLLIGRVGQLRDAVALQATMQGRARQMWDCCLESVEAIIQRKECVASERHNDGLVLAGQYRGFWLARPCVVILG